MPVRLATICGLVAPLTYTAALVFGGLAQPDAFSSAHDAISDLGSDTASSGWIYNQIGLNLTGVLVVVFSLGLWRDFRPTSSGASVPSRSCSRSSRSSSKVSSASTARPSTRGARTPLGTRRRTAGRLASRRRFSSQRRCYSVYKRGICAILRSVLRCPLSARTPENRSPQRAGDAVPHERRTLGGKPPAATLLQSSPRGRISLGDWRSPVQIRAPR
jgi:hypothetical protein